MNAEATGSERVQVGTSGYSFEDWRGRFYPADIPKGKMLDHYVKFFPTVEINSTYYRVPHPAVFANLVKKTPEAFDFMVKVPQSFTHRRDLSTDRHSFLQALAPVADAGRLAGLLAQFPYSFKFSSSALDYVCRCRDSVSPYPLYVEFRHAGWVNRTMYDRLRSEGIGYVCVDEPALPGLLKPDVFATTDIGYIRLHGRNAAAWWQGGPERYDYRYSEEELREWRERVQKLLARVKRVYVYFNNCHLGHAADNAAAFLRLLRESGEKT